MPFGRNCEFPDFDACVVKMTGEVDDPQAFCGALMRDTEDDCKAKLKLIGAFRQGAAGIKATSSAAQKKLFRAVDTFDWKKWNAATKRALDKEFRAIVKEQGAKTAASLSASFNFLDPFVQKELTKYVADRIKELETTTKADVKALIQSQLVDGVGTTSELGDKIRDAVQEKFAGYEDWRADRIARTETAIAYNNGTVFAARQAGVKKVEVSDGDDDEACAAANGQIWTLEEALAEPVAHPNCTRSFSPVPEGEDE